MIKVCLIIDKLLFRFLSFKNDERKIVLLRVNEEE